MTRALIAQHAITLNDYNVVDVLLSEGDDSKSGASENQSVILILSVPILSIRTVSIH